MQLSAEIIVELRKHLLEGCHTPECCYNPDRSILACPESSNHSKCKTYLNIETAFAWELAERLDFGYSTESLHNYFDRTYNTIADLSKYRSVVTPGLFRLKSLFWELYLGRFSAAIATAKGWRIARHYLIECSQRKEPQNDQAH